MLTSGPFFRGLLSWMARATSSLPVPLSPSINTGRVVSITRSSTSKMASIARLEAMMAL